MNKTKLNCKKYLVRNPEDLHPKTIVQQLPQLEESDTKPIEVTKEKDPEPQIDLSVPKLNSTLCVKKRVKKVEEKKPRKIKNDKELSQSERITIDEKITKQMNYPFDKKLYKELISLKLSDKPVFQPSTTAHEPVLRDKVPKLENFFTPPANFEYSIPASSNLGAHTPSKQFDGLRLHKIMRTWKENRPD